jgi:hypothetical protein
VFLTYAECVLSEAGYVFWKRVCFLENSLYDEQNTSDCSFGLKQPTILTAAAVIYKDKNTE